MVKEMGVCEYRRKSRRARSIFSRPLTRDVDYEKNGEITINESLFRISILVFKSCSHQKSVDLIFV